MLHGLRGSPSAMTIVASSATLFDKHHPILDSFFWGVGIFLDCAQDLPFLCTLQWGSNFQASLSHIGGFLASVFFPLGI